jgi:hypothetical protein
MPAKVKNADVLRSMGYAGEVNEFRRTLAAVKAEMFPDLTDESLCFTRDEASAYCAEVKRRLGAPKLTRVFILKALVSLRKHGWAKKARRPGRPRRDGRSGANPAPRPNLGSALDSEIRGSYTASLVHASCTDTPPKCTIWRAKSAPDSPSKRPFRSTQTQKSQRLRGGSSIGRAQRSQC